MLCRSLLQYVCIPVSGFGFRGLCFMWSFGTSLQLSECGNVNLNHVVIISVQVMFLCDNGVWHVSWVLIDTWMNLICQVSTTMWMYCLFFSSVLLVSDFPLYYQQTDKLLRFAIKAFYSDHQMQHPFAEADRQNNGKACILTDTTRILRDLLAQLESLRKENSTLQNESHYVSCFYSGNLCLIHHILPFFSELNALELVSVLKTANCYFDYA